MLFNINILKSLLVIGIKEPSEILLKEGFFWLISALWLLQSLKEWILLVYFGLSKSGYSELSPVSLGSNCVAVFVRYSEIIILFDARRSLSILFIIISKGDSRLLFMTQSLFDFILNGKCISFGVLFRSYGDVIS